MEGNCQLDSVDWGYIGEGVESIAMGFKGDTGSKPQFQGKILLLRKLDLSQSFNTQETNSLNDKLTQQHLNILGRFQNIQRHLLRYECIELDKQIKGQFLKEVSAYISTIKRSKKYGNDLDQSAPIRICDNLFESPVRSQSKQSIVFEFKPKTTMYTKYPKQAVLQACQKLNVEYNAVVDILEDAPNQEKCRWFKAKLIKDSNPISPFDTFSSGTTGYLDKTPKTLVFRNGHPSSVQMLQSKQVYDKIINSEMKSSRVLQEISLLQRIYHKSYFLFKDFSKQDIIKHLNQCDIHNEFQKLAIDLKGKDLEESNVQIDSSVLDENISAEILRYLISATWRDISFFVEVNILQEGQKRNWEGYSLMEVDGVTALSRLTIIDYNLKSVSRLFTYQSKELDLLQKYIDYKLNK